LIAEIYASQGKFAKAVEALEVEIKRDPLSAAPFKDLASTLTHMCRYADAEIYYARAASLEKGRSTSYLNRIDNTIMWKGYSDEVKTAIDLYPISKDAQAVQKIAREVLRKIIKIQNTLQKIPLKKRTRFKACSSMLWLKKRLRS